MQVEFIMKSSMPSESGPKVDPSGHCVASRICRANGGSEASSLLRAIMSLGAALPGETLSDSCFDGHATLVAAFNRPRFVASADDQATPLRLIRELSFSPHEDFAFGMLKSGVSH